LETLTIVLHIFDHIHTEGKLSLGVHSLRQEALPRKGWKIEKVLTINNVGIYLLDLHESKLPTV
jgi:hypothetical protein